MFTGVAVVDVLIELALGNLQVILGNDLIEGVWTA